MKQKISILNSLKFSTVRKAINEPQIWFLSNFFDRRHFSFIQTLNEKLSSEEFLFYSLFLFPTEDSLFFFFNYRKLSVSCILKKFIKKTFIIIIYLATIGEEKVNKNLHLYIKLSTNYQLNR